MVKLNKLRTTYSVPINELRKALKKMGVLPDLVADKLVAQRALTRMSTLASAKTISLTDL